MSCLTWLPPEHEKMNSECAVELAIRPAIIFKKLIWCNRFMKLITSKLKHVICATSKLVQLPNLPPTAARVPATAIQTASWDASFVSIFFSWSVILPSVTVDHAKSLVEISMGKFNYYFSFRLRAGFGCDRCSKTSPIDLLGSLANIGPGGQKISSKLKFGMAY